jgi:hypothetical protein
MSEVSLSYPGVSRRLVIAAAAAILALAVVAVALNHQAGTRPDLRRCAAAAARVMGERGYSVALMQVRGPAAVRDCRRLTAGQYRHALAATYRIEFGGRLSHEPLSRNLPPASFRAASAAGAARSR